MNNSLLVSWKRGVLYVYHKCLLRIVLTNGVIIWAMKEKETCMEAKQCTTSDERENNRTAILIGGQTQEAGTLIEIEKKNLKPPSIISAV